VVPYHDQPRRFEVGEVEDSGACFFLGLRLVCEGLGSGAGVNGTLDVDDHDAGSTYDADLVDDGSACDAASAISLKHLSVSIHSCFNQSAIVVSMFREGSNLSVALPLPLCGCSNTLCARAIVA